MLRCLQKDPARRYATARDLAADIERHLGQRPVLARGTRWTYVASKFVRRHAVWLAAATTVVFVLGAMSIIYTVRVVDERDKAERAARQAEAVSAFLFNLFESASPVVAQGRTNHSASIA